MQKTVILPENIEFETLQECDLCGSRYIVFWDSARSNTLYQCRACGLVFTNPRIANSYIKDKLLYSEEYFKQKSRMSARLVGARKKTYQKELDFLYKFFSGGRILDIGCGTGIFLSFFNGRWERHGCDVSSYALAEARKQGIKVYHGEFEKLDFGDIRFDVIYFRASLHHAYSPRSCLKKAYELLKPDGIAVICMSNNYDGLAGRLFKAHIRSYEQPHNYLFSTSTLKRYLMQSGFSIFHLNYPYWGTGYESYRDFLEIIPAYIKIVFMRMYSAVDTLDFYDFSSPAFYGNYINIYARKKVKNDK